MPSGAFKQVLGGVSIQTARLAGDRDQYFISSGARNTGNPRTKHAAGSWVARVGRLNLSKQMMVSTCQYNGLTFGNRFWLEYVDL